MGKNPMERTIPYPYTDSNLAIMEPDTDFVDIQAEFDSNESMADGVSGKKRIDTSFENTSVDTIQHMRSDKRDEGEIHDIRRGRYPHREL